MTIPTELLLLIFIHGFQGGNDSFSEIPKRLSHILSESQSKTTVESIVYPAYDTRGILQVAVDNHITWLNSTVAEKEAEFKSKGGIGPVRVVLLGHSMGGLVIVETALALVNSGWPDIIGIIAYDSPMYGLNPSIFSNTLSKAVDYVSQGQAVLTPLGFGLGAWSSLNAKPQEAASPLESSTAKKSNSKIVATTSDTNSSTPASSSSWLFKSALAVAGAAIVGGAGAAYLKRDEISTSFAWAKSHLSFVGELFSAETLELRMSKLSEAKIRFHCFYTLLPPLTSSTSSSRTFIVVPHSSNPLASSFTPNTNSNAKDEIQAHVEMFTDASSGMYSLGSETCRVLSDWLEDVRLGEKKGRSRKGKGAEVEEDVRLV